MCAWELPKKLEMIKVHSLLERVRKRFYGRSVPVRPVLMRETFEHESLSEALASPNWREVSAGAGWGTNWSTAWSRFRAQVPEALKGRKVVALVHTGGECVVWVQGRIYQGLDGNRSDVLLCERAAGGEEFDVVVEAGANDPFGRFRGRFSFGGVELAAVNEEVVGFYYDAWTLIENARVQEESSPWRARVTRLVSKAVDEFDYQTSSDEAVNESARRGRAILRELGDCPAARSWPRATCVGHAHIDVAWLWPLKETVRKCARTFGNQLRLMEEYDEFVFVQSQAQLYDYTRRRYPELYERIKAAAARGQWEVTGGMWVECDCNLVSGESMVRQFVLGRKLFEEDFGRAPEIVWLPDVFGYAASLPQIFRKCGMKYFLTQKISWSRYTRFPYHSFVWEGIDGTRIPTHFPPADTYNGNCKPEQMLKQANAYVERDRCASLLYVYGFGDGKRVPHHESRRRPNSAQDSLTSTPKALFMTTAYSVSQGLRTALES